MPHFPNDTAQFTKSGLSFRLKEASPSSSSSPSSSPHLDARTQRLVVKNRRKRYLDLHPEYFHRPELELADPLLYDRLVRRFLSAHERERDGRARGYTGVLEADLVRSEAKIEALRHPDPNSPVVYRRAGDGSIVGVEQDEEERAATREEGWARWEDFMGQRFLRGGDGDFEYAAVDGNEDFDDREEEERSRLEEYLDAETPRFVGDGGPVGETGIQDF